MAGIGERVGPFKLTARLEVDEGLELWEGVRADETLKKPSEVWIRLLTSEDPKEARRLRREYEALRSIDDPRVPMVVGFFAGQGSLAMTPLAGVSLRLVLRAAIEELVVLDVATAFDIVLDVAYALRAAHSILGTSERFVHGALSPEMVLVGPEGSVGVSGIGAGLHCPPHYRAPECLEGPPTRSSDQWQIGALLFELLTLRPFIHPLPMEHLRKDPGESLEALDPGDRRLLQRMLATDPKRRFHADQLREG